MNPAAMVALIDYREIDGEERPVMIASSEMSYLNSKVGFVRYQVHF